MSATVFWHCAHRHIQTLDDHHHMSSPCTQQMYMVNELATVWRPAERRPPKIPNARKCFISRFSGRKSKRICACDECIIVRCDIRNGGNVYFWCLVFGSEIGLKRFAIYFVFGMNSESESVVFSGMDSYEHLNPQILVTNTDERSRLYTIPAQLTHSHYHNSNTNWMNI